ncbi:hypothetical protein B7494_g3312 [Chlorociboria aeruginascens]|nr:hypothetical protein B7494_g3312 [Chlorociboria aeruginascens]
MSSVQTTQPNPVGRDALPTTMRPGARGHRGAQVAPGPIFLVATFPWWWPCRVDTTFILCPADTRDLRLCCLPLNRVRTGTALHEAEGTCCLGDLRVAPPQAIPVPGPDRPPTDLPLTFALTSYTPPPHLPPHISLPSSHGVTPARAPGTTLHSGWASSCWPFGHPDLRKMNRMMPLRGLRRRAVAVAVPFLWMLFWVATTTGSCECGYAATIGSTPTTPYVFTDLIESDFLHLRNISLDTDWKRQEFPVTPAAGRGPFGMNYTTLNVVSNPIRDHANFTGPGMYGGDPGLQLAVGGGIPANGYVQTAQLDSAREDLLWGSYRAALKLTLTPGTCSAFFWYFNDSQEIDMEFLSSQFDPESNFFPVNLVLQSIASVQAGYNAATTGNYIVAHLPFNPTTGFHEYRIDFIPGNVIFYADGSVLAAMNTSAVPTSPGHMILTQWSNGNPLWSAGPPPEESIMTVSYVKAYFNSSSPVRRADWATRCHSPPSAEPICTIPDQPVAPDPSITTGNTTAADTFFFSNNDSLVVNQTVYHSAGRYLLGQHLDLGVIFLGLFIPFYVLMDSSW